MALAFCRRSIKESNVARRAIRVHALQAVALRITDQGEMQVIIIVEPVQNNTGGIRMPQTGRLYLSVNDDHLADNSGQFSVTVEVERSTF